MRPEEGEQLQPGGVLAVAAATVLGFEQMRVYVSYLVWTVGETTSRPLLGALTLAPFLAAAVAGPFVRLSGPRRGLLLAAGWLAALALAEKTAATPNLDLALAGGAVVVWGWFLAASLVTVRRGLALGLVIGAGLDLAIRLMFVTIDLPWTDHPLAALIVALLAAGLFLGARVAAEVAGPTGEPSWPGLAPLLGLGAWLALTHLITANPSLIMARTGAGFGVVAGALALGHAAGIQLASGMAARPAYAAGLTVLGGLGALALVGLWNGWALGPAWAAIASAAAALLLGGALRAAELPARRASATATGLWLAAAFTLFVAFAYLNYTAYGPPLLIAGMATALVGAGVAGASIGLLSAPQSPSDTVWPALASAMTLLVVGIVRPLAWSEAEPAGAAPSELTVMTFNIRAGFGAENRWDLERTARVIEAQRPDVIVLQEVTRGWLLAAGADQALWLSRRLGMPMVFGPAAGDLHGNLVLSPYRLAGQAHRYVAHAPSGLPRGAVAATLATESGDLLVLGTHLDYPPEATTSRQAQLGELLGLAGGRTPLLLLGDLNAEASAPEMAPLHQAGLIDIPARLGATDPTWPAHAPHRRIDHIFASPDLIPLRAWVVATPASDHRPVVARIRLP